MIFTWEDLINDPKVVRLGVKGDAFKTNGKATKLEKVDDYTIKWTFADVQARSNCSISWTRAISTFRRPTFIKPLHPKYNTSMDYKSFADALAPDNACPSSPWAPGCRWSTRPTSC